MADDNIHPMTMFERFMVYYFLPRISNYIVDNYRFAIDLTSYIGRRAYQPHLYSSKRLHLHWGLFEKLYLDLVYLPTYTGILWLYWMHNSNCEQWIRSEMGSFNSSFIGSSCMVIDVDLLSFDCLVFCLSNQTLL